MVKKVKYFNLEPPTPNINITELPINFKYVSNNFKAFKKDSKILNNYPLFYLLFLLTIY